MTDEAAADRHPALADVLRALLNARGPGRTICPSEVARLADGPGGDWRARMPDVHAIAEALAAAGEIALMQRGRPLGAARPKGAYRIGLAADLPVTSSLPSGRIRRP